MTESYHFIGIGGIGMSGLAKIALEKNAQVSGSDPSKNSLTVALEKQGSKIFSSHSEDHVKEGMRVIYSSGIREENPELLAAKEKNCPLLHRSEFLHELTKGQKTLAVTGTHGKTITSSLLAHVFIEAGREPSFAIGGILKQHDANAAFGKGQEFIIEADESDNSFLAYEPSSAIITNIGFDHMETFGSEDALLESFQTFIDKVTDHLVWCGDDERLKSLNPKGLSYGFSESCVLRASNFSQKGWNIHFDIHFDGVTYNDVTVPLVGFHQALNALGVFGLSVSLGIEPEAVIQALSTFEGTKRRGDKRKEMSEILIIDDYAHHPTELKTTLQGIRKGIGEKNLIALFQPHRYSRMKDCLEELNGAFDAADELIITDIYAAGEAPIEGIDIKALQEKVGKKGIYIPRDELKNLKLKPFDVLVTLGAGDITHVADEVDIENKTLTVGVLYGGDSLEHDISILSSGFVIKTLTRDPYQVLPLFIPKGGIDETELIDQIKTCDIVLPMMHGKGGEDGIYQGLLQALGVPFTGCDHTASGICMNKALLKHLMEKQGLKTATFIDFTKGQWKRDKQALLQKIQDNLKAPYFVKPVHLGSSFGVKRVDEDLSQAIDEAFLLDDHLLVEEALNIREIEFAVMGNEEILVFPPGEVCTLGKVYDYKAKYDEDWVQVHPKASLPSSLIEEGMALAKKAYEAAGCTGYARVDFFLDQNRTFLFNEINPIPGFTEISLFPKICEENGMTPEEMIDNIIILGLAKKR
jgi:UDP-N-acetylmuramate--alanine ligase